MWLTGLELEEYVIEFSNKDIDGRQLLNLDNSKMKVVVVFLLTANVIWPLMVLINVLH